MQTARGDTAASPGGASPRPATCSSAYATVRRPEATGHSARPSANTDHLHRIIGGPERILLHQDPHRDRAGRGFHTGTVGVATSKRVHLSQGYGFHDRSPAVGVGRAMWTPVALVSRSATATMIE